MASGGSHSASDSREGGRKAASGGVHWPGSALGHSATLDAVGGSYAGGEKG